MGKMLSIADSPAFSKAQESPVAAAILSRAWVSSSSRWARTRALPPSFNARSATFAKHTVFPKERYDVVIDAIFGTGFRSVPEGKFADAIASVNACGAYVIAADIPSGLNGDTGTAQLAVRADKTVTIGERKIGLYLNDGADLCGEIVRADIGIALPPAAYIGRFSARELSDAFPPKKKNSNKGSYGRAGILAGSRAYSGACQESGNACAKSFQKLCRRPY